MNLTELAAELTRMAIEQARTGSIPPVLTIVNEAGWKYRLISTPR